jgi:hypothetical protein
MRLAIARCVAFIAALAPASGDIARAAEPLVPIFDARLQLKPRPAGEASAERLKALLLPALRKVAPTPGCSEAFEVVDSAIGAFTRRGARQTAVLYHFCAIGRQTGLEGIAVLEGGRVAAHFAFEGRDSAIGSLRDLDGDGFDELLLAGSASGQGHYESSVAFLALGRSKVRSLGRVTSYHDDCGAHDPGSMKALLLFVARGRSPRFFREDFVKPCDVRADWRKLVARRPLRLEKDGTRYMRVD